MLQSCASTGLILAWCLLLSLLWSAAVFTAVAWRWQTHPPAARPANKLGLPTLLLPALVLAPLLLLTAYRWAGVNLLYPTQLFASGQELGAAALAPAVVLAVTSGLLARLTHHIAAEYRYWQAKPFARLTIALGQSLPGRLRRLVLGQALGKAWTEALPWLFGELIVVEAMFNAPGLGLDLWQSARQRDTDGLSAGLACCALLYGLCLGLKAHYHRRLGRLLESYV